MSTILLTTQQYSDRMKKNKVKQMNRFSVFKAIQKNKLHRLPGVISIQKVGRYSLLEVVA